MQSIRYSCQISMELEFSRQIFEKHLNIKFHENPSSCSRAATCGRTEGWTYWHDEANSRFSQFHEQAWKLYCMEFHTPATSLK